jgi:hypothetical protein
VFTARYALSLYIKQIRFVFKGLNSLGQLGFSTERRDMGIRERLRVKSTVEDVRYNE